MKKLTPEQMHYMSERIRDGSWEPWDLSGLWTGLGVIGCIGMVVFGVELFMAWLGDFALGRIILLGLPAFVAYRAWQREMKLAPTQRHRVAERIRNAGQGVWDLYEILPWSLALLALAMILAYDIKLVASWLGDFALIRYILFGLLIYLAVRLWRKWAQVA